MNRTRLRAEYVMDFAKKNYNKYGWDFVAECLTIDEISAALSEEKITTKKQALKFYRNAYNIVNEKREEAQD